MILFLDAMGMVKLNVLHWHITDAQSFPLELNSLPELSEIGAYSPTSIYRISDIKSIIEFAKHRGIRIIPEFDAPAHVGEGWQFKDVVTCFKAEPWQNFCLEPPCGQFDVTKDAVYEYLNNIYSEINEIFEDPEFFHMGGDEVNFHCWNSTESIREWMNQQGWTFDKDEDFIKLWGYFQERAFKTWEQYSNSDIILWSSTLTSDEYIDEYLDKSKYIIQYWDDISSDLQPLLQKGYRFIISQTTPYYLDCGFGNWIGTGLTWCSPYNPWTSIYEYDIIKNYAQYSDQILGAEVCIWSEVNDEVTIDSRLWPRASAMAERLWSNPVDSVWEDSASRMFFHR